MRRWVIAIGILVLVGLGIVVGASWSAMRGMEQATGQDNPSGTEHAARSDSRNAHEKTESVAVGPFTGLSVQGSAEVSLVGDGGNRIDVTVPDDRTRVRIDIDEGTLRIDVDWRHQWWDALVGTASFVPRITVHYRALDHIATAGAVKLRGAGLHGQDLALRTSGTSSLTLSDVQAHALRIEGSGAIKATVSGKVESQTVHISGAGDYRAADLVSRVAVVRLSGAGRAVVNAEDTLQVVLSGAGNVEYLGNPRVTQHVSGVGRVRRREPGAG